MNEIKETFSYSYSAAEQEEIRAIRSKYTTPVQEAASIERLRRLDAGAGRGASAAALSIGAVSALLFCGGMCCAMVRGQERYLVPEAAAALAGMAGMIISYPVYSLLLKRSRERLAPEIMRITDELLK